MSETKGTTNSSRKWLCYGRASPDGEGIMLAVVRRRPNPMSIRFDRETLVDLRFTSIIEDRSLSSIVNSAVRQYLRGKRRLDG